VTATAGEAVMADAAMVDAYSATGTRWRDGPAIVYDRLAAVLVARTPVPLQGAAVVDIGAGTGAASFAALHAGATSVLAVDSAAGMLAVDAAHRPPSVVADATHLPFDRASFDVALAAFSFNHLRDPAAGFLEAARVVKPGGAVVASAYADDDKHPVKAAVEQALRNQGWRPTAWQIEMYRHRVPQLATARACTDVITTTGLDATVTKVRVGFPDLVPSQWVAWRLGMAQHAPFVATLSAHQLESVVRDALDELGEEPPPLVRSVMIVTVRC
jgi:SAM-dependent methyltransferase